MNRRSLEALDAMIVRAVEVLFDALGACAVHDGARSRPSSRPPGLAAPASVLARSATRPFATVDDLAESGVGSRTREAAPTVAAIIGFGGTFRATLTVATTPDLLVMTAGVALHDQAVRDRARDLACALATLLSGSLRRSGVTVSSAPPVTIEGPELSLDRLVPETAARLHVFGVRGIPISIRLDFDPESDVDLKLVA